jgi:hypothetical protein
VGSISLFDYGRIPNPPASRIHHRSSSSSGPLRNVKGYQVVAIIQRRFMSHSSVSSQTFLSAHLSPATLAPA